MRLKGWRPNCLVATPPLIDDLDCDELHNLLDEGVLFSRFGLLIAAFRQWRDFMDPQRSGEPELGWSELLGGLDV